ncbi:MAG: Cd(II)/Pb(II)-responsive transcriptional regulator [Desulfovibrio sp.]|jgi:Cd(II)/Pb(II)-responsive transcriptional regulator|nr:Cd(II)/Pb(II)-responsive transcriptional regulator [Desulfovibrio sp.]
MKIGELAKRTGCRVVTVRYYEKEGLLAKPERTEGNYRLYGQDDLERLEFIMHCREHGMKPAEIRELLLFRDNPRRDCTWVSDLISAHIADVDERIASLKHLREHLEQLRGRCGGEQSGEVCGIIRSLDDRTCCASCGRHEISQQL